MTLRNLFGAVLAAMVVLMMSTLARKPAADEGTLAKTTLTIRGMTCGGCVASVKLRLGRVKGVIAYEVSLDKAEAEVTFDSALTNPDAIAAAVSETGFKATVKPKDGQQGGKRSG